MYSTYSMLTTWFFFGLSSLDTKLKLASPTYHCYVLVVGHPASKRRNGPARRVPISVSKSLVVGDGFGMISRHHR